MKLYNKHFIIPILSLSILLSGCSDNARVTDPATIMRLQVLSYYFQMYMDQNGGKYPEVLDKLSPIATKNGSPANDLKCVDVTTKRYVDWIYLPNHEHGYIVISPFAYFRYNGPGVFRQADPNELCAERFALDVEFNIKRIKESEFRKMNLGK